VSDQVTHPYKTTGRIIVLRTLIFKFFDSKLEDLVAHTVTLSPEIHELPKRY